MRSLNLLKFAKPGPRINSFLPFALKAASAQRIGSCRHNSTETMDSVREAVQRNANHMLNELESRGWSVVDNFLMGNVCEELRVEAEDLYQHEYFTQSQSTKWDEETDSTLVYNNENVYSMQLDGGDQYYLAPKLHEYVVALTKEMQPLIVGRFPQAKLCDLYLANKLAVCVGGGGAYEKHYDHTGVEDARKITLIYYMNKWRPECGGLLRIHGTEEAPIPEAEIESKDNESSSNQILNSESSGSPSEEQIAVVEDDIEKGLVAPLSDRLVVFWADSVLHGVLPSSAPRGREDHRYALTVWFTSSSTGSGTAVHSGDAIQI
jgi:hypothetical protein